MGLLIEGEWHTNWYETKSTGGEFIRKDSQFRHQLGEPGFEVEAGRYHLFISLACPCPRAQTLNIMLTNSCTTIALPIRHKHCFNLSNNNICYSTNASV